MKTDLCQKSIIIRRAEFNYYEVTVHIECGKSLSTYLDKGYGEEIEWECDYCMKKGTDRKSVIYKLNKQELSSIDKKKIKLKGILSHEEVAEIMGVTPMSLTSRINKKEINISFIEPVKGKKMYKESDVLEYIERLFREANE